MTTKEEIESALAEVDATARVYARTKRAHDAASDAAIDAALSALRVGARPEAVAQRSPYTSAYLRRRARAAGIEAPKKRSSASA